MWHANFSMKPIVLSFSFCGYHCQQVADTYDNARLAAGKVKVDYDMHNLEAPVMTCEDAIAKNSMHPQIPPFKPRPIGNVEESLREAQFHLEGEVSQDSIYL